MDSKTARRRRRGRELAAQMLSSWEANPAPGEQIIRDVGALTRASAAHLEFAGTLARAAWERLPEIDRRVGEATRPWWRDNMGRVERSVLRVAVAELLVGSAPPRVVLTEAVEVARRYAGEASTSFIHAVVDAVIQGFGPEGEPEPEPQPGEVTG